MLSLEFLPEAEADMRRLYGFLSEVNAKAAVKAVDAILENIDLLRAHPDMGRRFETHPSLREWTVRFGDNGYIIHYSVKNDMLLIVRVWHTREAR